MPKTILRGFSLDLSDGYFHFRLHPLLRKYFTFNVMGEWFECIGLPFGFNWAPTLFTKVLRPVIAVIRNPNLILRGSNLLL